MVNRVEYKTDISFDLPMTRRNCLRFFIGSCGLFLALPLSNLMAVAKTNRQSIIDQFLGEELIYNIGFWLFSHCGNARTSFLKTDLPGIYRLGLEGYSVGFIDFLVGKLRYSYMSYAQFSAGDDRLRPVVFQITRKRAGKERRRSIVFDYAAKEIIFSKSGYDEQNEVQREPMTTERIYEDYLTLFFNFRYGHYGPLKRDTIYQLPLYIRKKMKSLSVLIVDHEQEKKQRRNESEKTDKDFFMQFQVTREDVSSGSGHVEGWLSSKAIPLKGTIKDVIFFGDLWGELLERRVADPDEIAIVPDSIKNQIHVNGLAR
jgi:hypothetical protein